MPNLNENTVRCEKCWRPAFQLPVGTIIMVYPRSANIATSQEKVMFNLCTAHMRIFREWVKGGQNKLPREQPLSQMKLMVNP